MGNTPTSGLQPEFLQALHSLVQDSISQAALKSLGQAAARSGKDSVARNERATFMASCGYHWSHVLTPDQKNSFLMLGKNMVDESGRNKPLDGYATLVVLANTLRAIGQPLPMQAPGTRPLPPPPLPNWSLEATRSLSGSVSIRILSAAAYDAAKIQVLCAPFVLSGQEYFRAKSFKSVALLDNLIGPPGGTALTPEIVDAYGIPTEGMKIAVKLQAITDDGFRGPLYLQTAIVSALSAENAEGDDDAQAGLHVG